MLCTKKKENVDVIVAGLPFRFWRGGKQEGRAKRGFIRNKKETNKNTGRSKVSGSARLPH